MYSALWLLSIILESYILLSLLLFYSFIFFLSIYVYCVDLFCRWRHSFLVSLLFGVPSMATMMFFGFIYEPYFHKKGKNDHGSHPQVILAPGLSLENVLMFSFATPVQVPASHFHITSLIDEVSF